MTVSVDKSWADNARVELYLRDRVQIAAIALGVENLATLCVNRDERILIKPLWCQQIVRGYLSDC